MSQFNFIYAEEHLSHREKAVYIYLRDRANVSGVCWPGIKTIARELGLSPRTVQRALADLLAYILLLPLVLVVAAQIAQIVEFEI